MFSADYLVKLRRVALSIVSLSMFESVMSVPRKRMGGIPCSAWGFPYLRMCALIRTPT